MPDFTFPLPVPQARLDGVEQALSANAADMASVLHAIGMPMFQAQIDNEKDLTSVAGRIKRQLGSNVRANQTSLAQVITQVADQAAAAIATNQSHIGVVQDAATQAGAATPAPALPGLIQWWCNRPSPDQQWAVVGGVGAARPAMGEVDGPFPTYQSAQEACGRLNSGLGPPQPQIAVQTTPPGFVSPPVQTPEQAQCPPGWSPLATPNSPNDCTAWFCGKANSDWAGTTFQAYLSDGIPPQYNISDFLGPFPTPDQCQAAAPPPGTGGTGGSGATAPPGGGAVVTPEQCPVVRWWVVCCRWTDPSGNGDFFDTITVVSGPDLPTVTTTDNIACTVSGPFDTQADANAARDALAAGDGCGPAPPIVAQTCVIPDAIKQGIPLIGGPEWCQAQPQIMELLASVGNAIVEWVISGVTTVLESMISAFSGPYSRLNPLASFLKALAIGTGKARDFVLRMLDCWRQLAQATATCSPATLLGLVVLKALLDWWRDAKFGISLGVTFTASLAFDLRPVVAAVDYLLNAVCPYQIPSAAAAATARNMGQIDEQTHRCWASAHGVSIDVWRPIRISQATVAEATQVIEFGRRVGADPLVVDGWLQERNFVRDQDRQWVQVLYDQWPQPTEWFGWEKADVLDETFAGRYQLDAGFPRFWEEFGQRFVYAKGLLPEFAKYHYRALWVWPGLGELHQFLYRLRPDKSTTTLPFGEDDLQRLLAAANYAPPAQEWLRQIRYRVLSESQLQHLWEWRHIDSGQWLSGMQDIGYSADTANQLFDGAAEDFVRHRASEVGGWTIGQAARLVRQQVMTTDEYVVALSGQGYSQEELDRAIRVEQTVYLGRLADRAAQKARLRLQTAALAAYQTGTLSHDDATRVVVSAGNTPTTAAALLSAIDTHLTQSIADKAVSAMKHAYLRGEISLAQAGSLLASAGIQPVRVQQHMLEWRLEFGTKRPMLATAQILKLVGEGLMPAAVAQQRLRNLGWIEPDLSLVEAEVRLKMEKQNAKAVAVAQKKQPESKLRKWFMQRVIDEAYVQDRLTLYGYDTVTVQFLLESWTADRAKAEAKAAGPSASQPLTQPKQVPIHTIRAWYLDRLMDESDVNQRMLSYGYTQPVIDTYLAEWGEQRAYRDAKAKPPAPV